MSEDRYKYGGYWNNLRDDGGQDHSGSSRDGEMEHTLDTF